MDFVLSICIDYGTSIFTLVDIRFIVKTQDIYLHMYLPRNYMQLEDKRRFKPHFTYHGTTGHIHSGSYDGKHEKHSRFCRDAKKLDNTFSDIQPFMIQGFGRNYAKKTNHPCTSTHAHFLIPANDIGYKEEIISDKLGSVTTELPTASFQIDFIEPGRRDLINKALNKFQVPITQQLFTQTYPWCLVSIVTTK